LAKAFECGPKVPGSNHTCCITDEVISLPLLPLGGMLSLAEKGHKNYKYLWRSVCDRHAVHLETLGEL